MLPLHQIHSATLLRKNLALRLWQLSFYGI